MPSINKQNIYLGLVSAVILAAMFLNRDAYQRRLPVFHAVGDFILTDSANRPFQFQKLRGKVIIVDFIFTTCQGVCPMMTKNMKTLYEQFRDKKNVAFLSITVNPEYDTPDILAKYVKNLNIDPNQWVFLTGTRDSIQRVAVEKFKIGSVDEPVFHSAYFVLVDQHGNARGYYDGSEDAMMQKLANDTKLLTKG